MPAALTVIRLLDDEHERIDAGLRGTEILMVVTFGSLLGVSALILLMTRRRRHEPSIGMQSSS